MPVDLASFGASGAVVVVVVIFLKFIREEGDKRDETYRLVSKSLDRLSVATTDNTKVLERDVKKYEELLKATKAIPPTLEKIATTQAQALNGNGK